MDARNAIENTGDQNALAVLEQYKTLLENVPVTICRFDREMRYVYVNQAVEASTGILPAAYIGKTSRELGLSNENSILLWEQTIQKVFDTGEKHSLETTYPAPDGKLHYYQSIYVPEFGPDHKKVETVLYLGNDVTDFRRAEHQLAEQKQEFSTLLEHILDVVARYDRELRCTYINSTVERALGLAADFFIGRTIHELGMPAEQVALWDKTIREVFESGQPRVMEFELQTLKGLRYFRSDVVPEFNSGLSGENSQGVNSVLCISHDVTEQKQVEEKLRLSEYQYRTLVEFSPDTISLYDRELRHVYISPAVEKRTGYAPEFFIGKSAQELGMPLEEREQWEEIGHKVFETGQAQMFEFRSWLSNQERFSQILLLPKLSEDGTTVEYIFGINRDITELKIAQRALEERERQYRTLIENSPDIITRYDQNLQVTFVNSSVEKSTGRPAQFYLGRTLYELGISPYQIDCIKQVFESGVPQQLEYSAGIPDSGETRSFQARIIPEFNTAAENTYSELQSGNSNLASKNSRPAGMEEHSKNRTVKSVITITTDITALKKSELVVATQKERLDTTLRSIAEGVVATDAQGYITVFNIRAETLTACPAEKALGQPFEKIVRLFDESQQTFLNNLVKEVLEKGAMLKLGNTVTNPVALLAYSANSDPAEPDNQPTLTRKLIEGRASPLYHFESGTGSDSQRMGIVFVFEDITQRHRMEEELQKADKLEAVGVLAAGIAHDFNNFLTAILGNLAFIRRNLPETSALSKNLREAENACLNARGLTQQLLTFAQGGNPVKKTLAIGEILEETSNFILRGTSTRCHLEVADDLWQAELDSGQISQVIYNLALNAQQAMPEGGTVKIRAKNVVFDGTVGEIIKSSKTANQIYNPNDSQFSNRGIELEEDRLIQETFVVKPGPYIQLEVQDEGVGIPAKYLSRIFDPYFTTKQKGSGLGLSVCYSIVKNHDGYINVVSEPGIGTTFFIYLPALKTVEGLESTTATVSGEQITPKNNQLPNEQPSLTKSQLRVLVMDDQEMILELVNDVLTDTGHLVDLVADGETAISYYQKALEKGQPYDVVIMDLTIPGRMGGKETIAELRKLIPEIKAIVSSGYSNDPITSNYREYGFSAVLPKPFDIDDLVTLVEKLAKSA